MTKFFKEEDHEAVMKVFTDIFESDFDQFLEDTEGENILQVVLRGHLYIERELTSFLEIALKNPDALIKGRVFYGQKLNIAHAIGILSEDDKLSYEKIGEVRNSYAHKWGFDLEHSHVNTLIDSFKGGLKELYDEYKVVEPGSEDLVSTLRTAIGLMWTHLRILTEQYKDQTKVRDLSALAFRVSKGFELTSSEQELFDELMEQHGDEIMEGVEEKRRLMEKESTPDEE